MNVKQATVLRFQEIMKTRNIRPNELANLSGVTLSKITYYAHAYARNRKKQYYFLLR